MTDTRIHLLSRDRLLLTGCIVPFSTRRIDGCYADADSAIRYEDGAPVYRVDYEHGDELVGFVLEFHRQANGLWADIELYAEHPDTPGVLAAVEAGTLFFCYEQAEYARYRDSGPLDGYLPSFRVNALRIVEFPHYTPSDMTPADYLQHLRDHQRAVPPDWTAERASRAVRRVGSPLPTDVPVYRMESVNTDIPPQTVAPAMQAVVPRDGSTVLAWDQNAPRVAITTQFLKAASPPWRDITPTSTSGAASTAYDFITQDYGATFPTTAGWTPTTFGSWVSGQGFVVSDNDYTANPGTERRLTLIVDIPVSFLGTVTSITFEYDWVKGLMQAGSDPGDTAVQFFVDGVSIYSSHVGNPGGEGSGTGKSQTITGSWTNPSTIHVYLMCSRTVTATPTGTARIYRITLAGTGASISHINHGMFDVFPGSGGKAAAYLLADDGTRSFVFRAEDVNANPPDWVLGASLTGLFKTLRLGNVKGQILAFAPDIGGSAKVAVSSDYGATWAAPVTVGTAAANAVGVDTEWLAASQVVLAAQDQKVRKASTITGSYSDETNGAVTGAQPTTIILPWYLLDGLDTTKNTGVNPDYFLGASALVSGEALWKVRSGSGKTAITPSSGGTKSLAVSANGLTCWRGKRIAYLGSVSGTTKLFASSNTGSSWVEVGNYASTFVLIRRRSTSPGLCYWNVGATIKCSQNIWAASPVVQTRSTPLSAVSGVDIL